ncbi:hypothetical protein [Vibrio astriarenae]
MITVKTFDFVWAMHADFSANKHFASTAECASKRMPARDISAK